MKPGRKPIPRAERLSRGLPVCAEESCDRAPNSKDAKRCRRHGSKTQWAVHDGETEHLNMHLPAAIHAAAKARAAEERMSLALWVTGALARALAEATKTRGPPP